MYHMFKNAAEYCYNVYGSEVFEEDGVIIGFMCPCCGELFYFDDWTDEENWLVCPICFEAWSDDEE